jgi:hypothetical protein
VECHNAPTFCDFHGDLTSSDDIIADESTAGYVPAGRKQISFVFDAALITADPKREWTLSPWLNCGSVKVSEERPLFIKVNLDPSKYEARHEPFLFVAPQTRVTPGRNVSRTIVAAIGKGDKNVAFRVAGAVPGLTVRIASTVAQGDNAAVIVTVQADPAIAVGRYFVPLEATAAEGTATTDLVVDVMK